MKVYSTRRALFLVRRRAILECCKITGKLRVLPDFEAFKRISEKNDLGNVHGLVGILRTDGVCYLLLIVRLTAVATFPCSEEKIFRIDKICSIPVENNDTIDEVQIDGTNNAFDILLNQQKKLLKFMGDKTASTRTIDEVLRLFNSDGDFYVSFGRNLTLNTQSYYSGKKKVDVRFFWNQFLLSDLYDENGIIVHGADGWISPICQGFVCESKLTIDQTCLTLTLISRRSVERAGVRYLRRGVDVDGKVANFVETEVILNVFGHQLSFVQVRGSVPVFWTQKGYRYRPPLVIDKPFTLSFPAFEKHMDELKTLYSAPVIAVCLVDQTGRELGLALSYLQHIIQKDSADIDFYAFDFHFQCRGLRFQKAVGKLLSALQDRLKAVSFCWVDKTNIMICEQSGVVRTNCVDCLDRTNVVQGAISQAVCLLQLQKLGLVGPLSQLPEEVVRILQSFWADNGDAISRQYAGTNALKGDVTRSGQRGLVGMMRDGYNSASRYYYSHMKDARRQLAIDVLLGSSVKVVDDTLNGSEACVPDSGEEDESENIGRLVNETAQFVLAESEMLVGGWALVDACNSTDQVDTVLLLTRRRIVLALFDDDTENLVDLNSINFEDITAVELGTLGDSSRVHLRISTAASQRYTLRAAKTRLFNNVAIPIKSEDEADEYVQAIAEQVRTTVSMAGFDVPLTNLGVFKDFPVKKRPRFVSLVASVFRSKNLPNNSKSLLTAESGSFDESKITSRNSKDVMSVKSAAEALSRQRLQSTTQGNTSLPMKQTSLATGLNVNKLPISKSQTAMDSIKGIDFPARPGPFSHYRQQILNSKSHIMLL